MPPLTPLMEGLDLEMQDEGSKKESSWEIIREWFRMQKSLHGSSFSDSVYGSIPSRRQDLRLLLGVLGCPLAPIPLANLQIHHLRVKDIPFVRLPAKSHYYLLHFLYFSKIFTHLCILMLTGNFFSILHTATIFGSNWVFKETKV